MPKRPTIKDVAKLAGVNPSTVSRVLAGSPLISEKTREKVKKAMAELGYHPDLNARNLARNETGTLGLVLPRAAEELFQNPFFPEVLRGITSQARKAGYDLLLSSGTTEREEREAVLRLVDGRRCDGLILLVSRTDDVLMKELEKRAFPAVVIGKPLNNYRVGFVDNDNIGASFLATNYLIQKGHRQIGLIVGALGLVVSLDRLEGYKKAIKSAGFSFDRRYVVSADFSEEGGYRGVYELKKRFKNLPGAILCADDLQAFGAYRAIRELGLRVPEDVSVVGFNNVPLSSFVTPPLTTVDIHIYELGTKAVELLIQIVKGGIAEIPGVLVPVSLIERNSVAARI